MSETVAAQVRRLRTERGWSAARLAERCRELGLEIQRDVIANLENGRRSSVTVEELAGLALALDTSPVVLLLPLGEQETVAITSTMTMHPHLALEWFAAEEYAQYFSADEPWDGERLPHGQDRGAWLASTNAVQQFRRLREVQDRVTNAESDVRQAAFRKDEEAERDALARYAAALTDLGTVMAVLEGNGWSTPTLHPKTAKDMKRLGIEVPHGEH